MSFNIDSMLLVNSENSALVTAIVDNSADNKYPGEFVNTLRSVGIYIEDNAFEISIALLVSDF